MHFQIQGQKQLFLQRLLESFLLGALCDFLISRTVPNQDPEKITQLVKDFVYNEFKKLNSKNSVKIDCDHAGKWVKIVFVL